jgi:hypothetical protein
LIGKRSAVLSPGCEFRAGIHAGPQAVQALVELNDVPRDALSERRGGTDVPAVTLALIVVYIAEEKQHREHCNVSVICVSALRSVCH